MGKGGDDRRVFPLTSLQIGDLQSYLSDIGLFLALESDKFYILVDNRPWLRDLGSRSAFLWQLMVTKSRFSPFANTKARRERKEGKEGKEACPNFNASKPKKYGRWFSLINAATLSRKRDLLPVKKLRNSLLFSGELHRTLYGFIVFEVSWTNVRGINYFNELQTDTSLAIETRFMQRWEFDSIAQAAGSISSWFSGTHADQILLKEYLDSAIGEVFYDAEEYFSKTSSIDDDDDDDDNSICKDNICTEDGSPHSRGSGFSSYPVTSENNTCLLQTPPAHKRRKVIKSFSSGVFVDIYSDKMQREFEDNLNISESYTSDSDHSPEATQYRDVLILLKFNDPDLPFKLRQIIMPVIRLLTLLEAGLPSWVIFLQSYPGFCHLYRPWMCLLARALYVLISVVTVLIGFYDLYKNVPVLKETASRLSGPLLGWIETWEMISRIKYLGTMLFLHNVQKAIKWFLAIMHTTRSFFSVVVLPLAAPLVELFGFLTPIWNEFIAVVEGFCSVIWIVFGSSFNLVGDLIEILLLPIWIIISFIWSIANTVLCPIFWILWGVLYAPIRLALTFSSFVVFIYACLYDLLGDIWTSVSSLFQLASASGATASSLEVSVWRSLWNDLFSQVFRALRSILNGFVAFFTACNRHRLSIYNHSQEFIQRLLHHPQRSLPADSRNSIEQETQNLPQGRRKVHVT